MSEQYRLGDGFTMPSTQLRYVTTVLMLAEHGDLYEAMDELTSQLPIDPDIVVDIQDLCSGNLDAFNGYEVSTGISPANDPELTALIWVIADTAMANVALYGPANSDIEQKFRRWIESLRDSWATPKHEVSFYENILNLIANKADELPLEVMN